MVDRFRGDPELGLALWRLPVFALCAAYYTLSAWKVDAAAPGFVVQHLGVISAAYIMFSLVMLAWVDTIPNSNIRGSIGAAVDLGLFGALLQTAGTSVAPLMIVQLLIVVSYGLRVGTAAMITAQVVAIGSVSWLWALNQGWLGDGYFASTWILALIIVPIYAYGAFRKVKDRNAELTKLAAQRAKLLASASHDIRHPLHASAIFAAKLTQTGLSDEQAKLVGNVEQALNSAGEMLQSYLDLSLIQYGRVSVFRRQFAIQQIFDELRMQCQAAADRASVQLQFAPTRMETEGDKVILKTMIQNLVLNAVHHAPGTKVLVGCRRINGELAIQISDRGPGGDCGHDRVNEKGDCPRNAGLGMSIVFGLARLAGLRIVQYSRPRGYHVRIKGLPTVQLLKPLPDLDVGKDVRPLSGTRVLLVNDDVGGRGDAETLFKRWGCDVVCAARMDRCNEDVDMAIIQLKSIDRKMVVQIRRMKVPAIVITETAATLPSRRRRQESIIEARGPVDPAQMRSMMMALR
nr:HAMP domain-containing sensor histidine kinase [uncultured Sphingomonas sp.]